MKNYIQDGEVISLVAPYAVSSGNGALVGSVFGVATETLASGATGNFGVSGVFDLTKKAGDVPTQGVLLYWDNTNKYVTVTSTTNTLIGYAVDAALSGDATVRTNLICSL